MITTEQFHQEMLEMYRRARSETGYVASYFLRMVNEMGGVETAKKLVASPQTDGFTKLWEKGRLDLTCEALVIQHADLFDPELVDLAVTRLNEFGYTVRV